MTITDEVYRLAQSGLGWEDISVRLKLTLEEREFAKQVVLKKIAKAA